MHKIKEKVFKDRKSKIEFLTKELIKELETSELFESVSCVNAFTVYYDYDHHVNREIHIGIFGEQAYRFKTKQVNKNFKG